MVIVRDATAGDVPRVLAMAREFLFSGVYRDLVPYHHDHLEALAGWLIEEQLLLVAEEADAVIGMLGMAIVPSTLSGEQTASEVCWWIDPAARKSTAAVRLWEAAEVWAEAEGALWIQMISPGCDLTVAGFYQRRGYQLLETVWQRRIGD